MYDPVAVNCWVAPPDAMDGSAGVMVIEDSTSAVTVKVVEPEMAPEVAVMFVVPMARLLANPLVPLLLPIVATVAADELHCTVVVRFCVLRSVNVPVAVNCCPVPSGIDGMAGVIAIDTSWAGETVRVVDPSTEPDVAEIVVVPRAALLAIPAAEIEATVLADELQVTVEVMF